MPFVTSPPWAVAKRWLSLLACGLVAGATVTLLDRHFRSYSESPEQDSGFLLAATLAAIYLAYLGVQLRGLADRTYLRPIRWGTALVYPPTLVAVVFGLATAWALFSLTGNGHQFSVSELVVIILMLIAPPNTP